MVAELANADNSHDPGNFGSDQGSVTGYTVTGNNNINRYAPAKPATAGVQGGGKKRRRRKSRRRRKNRRKKRGGGYGFNPNGKPQFGRPPIKVTNNCGVAKDPDLGVATQFVGSPPPQRGGSRGGACGGCGGTPYYGFTAAVPGLNNYAPVTPECHAQCGGSRRRKRRTRRRRRKRAKRKTRRRKRAKRKTRRRVRRRTRRRVRRRRSGRRGGYSQYGSNIPSTPGYATPNGGNWQTANPPTYARNDACGTGNCVDNYNHFTGKGFASPVFDQDVNPLPAPTVIKTPNNTTQCGGKRRRRRR